MERYIRLSLLAVLVTACGGDDDLSPSDYLAQAADIVCDYQVECGLSPDRATCEAQLRVDDAIAELQNAVDASRVSFDASKARACLSALRRELSCTINALGLAFDDCDEVATGLVPLGDTCYDDDECAGDAECQGGDTVESCTGGTCVAVDAGPPPVGEGADCSAAPCQTGLFCKRGETGAQTCASLAGVGEPCQALASCAAGLVCSGGLVGEGVCFDPPARGEQCDPELGFLACEVITDLCDPTDAVCKARPRPGDACNPDNDQCIGYAYCNSEGRCEQNPGEGDACSTELGAPDCLGSFDCVNGVCALDADVVCLPAA
jgi:hypothetical protein